MNPGAAFYFLNIATERQAIPIPSMLTALVKFSVPKAEVTTTVTPMAKGTARRAISRIFSHSGFSCFC